MHKLLIVGDAQGGLTTINTAIEMAKMDKNLKIICLGDLIGGKQRPLDQLAMLDDFISLMYDNRAMITEGNHDVTSLHRLYSRQEAILHALKRGLDVALTEIAQAPAEASFVKNLLKDLSFLQKEQGESAVKAWVLKFFEDTLPEYMNAPHRYIAASFGRYKFSHANWSKELQRHLKPIKGFKGFCAVKEVDLLRHPDLVKKIMGFKPVTAKSEDVLDEGGELWFSGHSYNGNAEPLITTSAHKVPWHIMLDVGMGKNKSAKPYAGLIELVKGKDWQVSITELSSGVKQPLPNFW